MASREIKKSLLKAFPMFYFRVRRCRQKHTISVVKGPVDFGDYVDHEVELHWGDGTFVAIERVQDMLKVGNDEARLLVLMAKHILTTLPSTSSGIKLKLGTPNSRYEVVNESDSTVLIKNGEGDLSYRGYDFKQYREYNGLGEVRGKWRLFHDDKPVMYNNELARRPDMVGMNIELPSIKSMKGFINLMCGHAYDERAALTAKLVARRHLYQIGDLSQLEYRGMSVIRESDDMWTAYDSNGEMVYCIGNLADALKGIDKYLKKS